MTSESLKQRLAALSTPLYQQAIKGIKRGIERECLRVNAQGKLSNAPHPKALGSALTNPYITTDFSEALLEFITPVSEHAEQTLAQLQDLQKFTLSQLPDELLWPTSMPCYIESQEQIPLAYYGESNSGKMKTLYREGLKNRYGSMMQAISGVHFNISFPESLFNALQQLDNNQKTPQAYMSDAYLGLIRNFQREIWLISYLFGASPALCSSFLQGRKTNLPFEKLGKGTQYLQHGTALRLGDLGYTNSAQSSLRVMYNNLDEYIAGLKQAISLPSEQYQHLGDYRAQPAKQLNQNILQIENEFYSPIRPKRNANKGEKPTEALQRAGIEYIEVRALDVNPFSDVGIDLTQIHFLDVFLTYCLLKPSAELSWQEQQASQANLDAVVNTGRDPSLSLLKDQQSVLLTQWAGDIFTELKQVAAYLDKAHGTEHYLSTINELATWVTYPERTFSGRYIAQLTQYQQDNGEFALQLAQQYQQQLATQPYQVFDEAYLHAQAKQSLQTQQDIEATQTLSFEAFLDDYFHGSSAKKKTENE